MSKIIVTVIYGSLSFVIFMFYSLFLMIIPRNRDFDYVIIYGAGDQQLPCLQGSEILPQGGAQMQGNRKPGGLLLLAERSYTRIYSRAYGEETRRITAARMGLLDDPHRDDHKSKLAEETERSTGCRRYGISVTEDNCIGYIKKGDELIGL